MSKLISKSKLVPLLVEKGFVADGEGVSYEAYGRKVFAYIWLPDMAARQSLENLLSSQGLKVNRQYSPGKPCVEVQVSYFKAYHWDE